MITEKRFSRTEMMLGKNNLEKLQKSSVAIIGLGGVGSYAAEAIARIGVGKIMLVDGDVVDESNLNRQLCALISNIGKSKAEIVAERIKDINPDCNVKAIKMFVGDSESDLQKLFDGGFDVVIEAIDTISCKINLLEYLQKNNIKTVSCMGAALRIDASKIKVGLLDSTGGCPLAAKVRKEFRKRGLSLELKCVYSSEKAAVNKINLLEKSKLGKSPLGSIPTIPAIIGLTAANEAIKIFLDNF